jgi:8-oxo-dGTP pyrophosphatase MutT (NUDIX family)
MLSILRQAGAIPFEHRKVILHVLLITSRGSGRWVIPKGGIEPGFTARQAAAQEAFEEAGIKGELDPKPLGSFTYVKRLKSGVSKPASVEVYALRVEKQLKKWPEQAERQFEWMQIEAAMAAVQESGVARLLAKLAERHGGAEQLAIQPAVQA